MIFLSAGAKRELGAMAAIWKKEGLGGGNSTYPVVTAKEFDNMERNQKNSVIQSWVELYGFLYRLGEKGYFIEMEDDVFLFTTSEDGRFSAFVGTQINVSKLSIKKHNEKLYINCVTT